MKNKILLSLGVIILAAAITFSYLKFKEFGKEKRNLNSKEEKALVMLSELTAIRKSKFKYIRKENDAEFVFRYNKSKDITTDYTVNVSTGTYYTKDTIIMN